ncbi:MAG: O-acetyl-ADP-ribose deacetylase [Clostridia bacterium]|nr:O-acetyl-ADP-ribose deacetylase [Clostridia bacterium]
MPFEIVRNDITKMRVDAIVNAANASLLGGGGVDGAIHRAAGPQLLAECRTLDGCETGQAKITKGYRLPARYVIHTVGPIWRGGHAGERELLTSCYRNSLDLADKYGCESVAFPLISAGIYGYPGDEAMNVAVGVVSEFLMTHDMMVYLVVFGSSAFMAGKKLFRDIQQYIDDVYVEAQESYDESRRVQRLRQLENLPLSAPKSFDAAEEDFSSDALCEETFAAPCAEMDAEIAPSGSFRTELEDRLKHTDEGFSNALTRLIDKKGLTDVQCYKRANVDRKLFSKIRSNPEYRPSKPTVVAFAVALELSLDETEDFMRKAGFALTHSSKFDIIVEFFINHGNYNVFEINEALFQYDMPLLGSGMN